jgi:hypothetical protein
MALDKRDREHSHRGETEFKRITRRNKLFGLWAAGELGLEGDAAEAYAKSVVAAELDQADGAIRKVSADLEAEGKQITREQIHKHLDECMIEARRQIGTV